MGKGRSRGQWLSVAAKLIGGDGVEGRLCGSSQVSALFFWAVSESSGQFTSHLSATPRARESYASSLNVSRLLFHSGVMVRRSSPRIEDFALLPR